MSWTERQSRFYRFAHMRLRGESDVTYRAYDLLWNNTNDLQGRSFKYKCWYAGLVWPLGGEYEILTTLQRYFMDDGYGVIPLDTVKLLVREYFIYGRIRYTNMRWRHRDPDDALQLHRSHVANTEVTGLEVR